MSERDYTAGFIDGAEETLKALLRDVPDGPHVFAARRYLDRVRAERPQISEAKT